MLTLLNYIERGVSWKNIPPSPIRNKNKTLHRTVNASSCLDLSAFTIGGRSRRNVLRTGGCRGPVSPRAHFLSHFHCVCSLRFRCGVLQLLQARASLGDRSLPRATPPAVHRPVCLSCLQFFFVFPRFFWCQNCPDRIGILNTASWARRN